MHSYVNINFKYLYLLQLGLEHGGRRCKGQESLFKGQYLYLLQIGLEHGGLRCKGGITSGAFRTQLLLRATNTELHPLIRAKQNPNAQLLIRLIQTLNECVWAVNTPPPPLTIHCRPKP
jgi:hypothetical protein